MILKTPLNTHYSSTACSTGTVALHGSTQHRVGDGVQRHEPPSGAARASRAAAKAARRSRPLMSKITLCAYKKDNWGPLAAAAAEGVERPEPCDHGEPVRAHTLDAARVIHCTPGKRERLGGMVRVVEF